MEEKNIVAIEIGSSKVKGAVGRIDDRGVLTVQAVEEEPLYDWVRYGVVSNVEEVSTITARILRKLENRLAPRKIKSVYLSIGGRSLCSMSRDVERQLPDEMEVTDMLLRQLKSEAASNTLPDRELLEVIPREYMVDKVVVQRPRGTFGRNVRMNANLLTCRPQLKRNLDRIITEKLQLKVNDYVVRQRAQGDIVLTDEEKRLGCMLVDFGAETTTVSIYKNGRLQYMSTLPLGSRNITRDITKLNYLEEQAEELKCNVGHAINGLHEHHSVGSAVDVAAVNNYVSHRAGEIIANINEQISYAGLKAGDLPGGIILVGRGARLRGFNDRLASTTGLKVRSGSIVTPQVVIADSRISPSDAVDVLSVLYSASLNNPVECLMMNEPELVPEPEPEPEPEPVEPIDNTPKKSNRFGGLYDRIMSILGGEDEMDDDEDLREDKD
jgi:cell division protein ftsA